MVRGCYSVIMFLCYCFVVLRGGRLLQISRRHSRVQGELGTWHRTFRLEPSSLALARMGGVTDFVASMIGGTRFAALVIFIKLLHHCVLVRSLMGKEESLLQCALHHKINLSSAFVASSKATGGLSTCSVPPVTRAIGKRAGGGKVFTTKQLSRCCSAFTRP